jgi:hypothetical protein
MTCSQCQQDNPQGAKFCNACGSRGRMAFDVPVAEAAATYRVLVESVDWVAECR